MIAERIIEYGRNGGKLFNVTMIDTIRDDGTIIIKTKNSDYYINKDNNKIHSEYPLTNENLITNFLLIEYLFERIEVYIKHCEEDIKRNKNMLKQIKKIYL